MNPVLSDAVRVETGRRAARSAEPSPMPSSTGWPTADGGFRGGSTATHIWSCWPRYSYGRLARPPSRPCWNASFGGIPPWRLWRGPLRMTSKRASAFSASVTSERCSSTAWPKFSSRTTVV